LVDRGRAETDEAIGNVAAVADRVAASAAVDVGTIADVPADCGKGTVVATDAAGAVWTATRLGDRLPHLAFRSLDLRGRMVVGTRSRRVPHENALTAALGAFMRTSVYWLNFDATVSTHDNAKAVAGTNVLPSRPIPTSIRTRRQRIRGPP
jgi:hypothetical protein